MNNNQLAYQELIKGIQQYNNDSIENANFDKTYTALIVNIGLDGYGILLNGIQYDDIPTVGGTCHINETVQVVVPQNNMNNMFILKFDNQSGGGGSSTDDYLNLNNKPSINGHILEGNQLSSQLGLQAQMSEETIDLDFSNFFN